MGRFASQMQRPQCKMQTLVKKIDAAKMTAEDFREAVELLRSGRLVAFPTETVYGLGGDAFDPTASARIYAAKGRPSDNPLIVHIADINELKRLCSEVPEAAYRLADKFWPGPLTMIMKKADCIPKETTGGLDTVAIRMPSHPIAKRLIEEAGLPIAAPSANASGRPSTTKAEHVIEDLDGRIDMIIDGGSSDIGLESTIVDLTCSPVQILRPGFITIEMLTEVIPDIVYDKAVLRKSSGENIVARAPGMKYRHYAPKGELTVFEGEPLNVISAVSRAAKEKLDAGFKVGILASEEYAKEYHKIEFDSSNGSDLVIEVVGSRDNEETVATNLFDKLRDFDTAGTPFIFGECFYDGDLGTAIMNRLLKAAGYHIVQV